MFFVAFLYLKLTPAFTAGALAAFNTAEGMWNMLGFDSNSVDDSSPDFFSDFVHGRPDLSCEILDNPNCKVTVNCVQKGTIGAPVSSPAGYVSTC